ncbi:Na+/H+ antiporter subunit E [Shinella yambaruensis]|uniref:Na+/H+ antiporter subunit E n=1 Tax=Shinella yambaruensis TaxID=415996 RepID=A0ABQ5ZDZ3_9HYPH|nr:MULTISPECIES: Na+/H+ antiporter subunit E [Shinella]CAI0336767.1 Na(+)/H(+) antiporter subunit E [Rhizobiaceae bacterium]CAK7255296.1 Na(+)/H(+) antiporter subunit E [Shinella sp. WSC3-e]MCJ8028615.1 Na+/H+ antiporter subunit E [Shinella yambaruensis]MCO5141447.1 Na+/H+ antiporter subunit E [Shinella sp.]MCU7982652.1 Na+/H+ antiporter subunit E [Shinella yambaruensis]
MRPAFTVALFALAWLAVSGSFTIPNLLLGIVAGALSLALIRDHIRPDGRRIRPLKVLSLLLLFIKELALSAWKVAVLVASPKMALKPGIFAFPLTVDRDFEITLLANLITLTPGTLSVDVSADRKVLYVHALDCSDPVGARRDIAGGFEKKILEAFR